MRSSSTVHRSSSSRAASRRSSPSSSEPSRGGPRQSAKAPRSTSTATSTSPSTSASRPRAASASKQRASISSSGTSRRYPPAAVTSASLSGPRARRSFDTSACRALAPPAGGSSPQSSSARRSAWTVSRARTRRRSSSARCFAPRMGRSTSPSTTWSSPSIRNVTRGRYAHLAGENLGFRQVSVGSGRRQGRGPRWEHDLHRHPRPPAGAQPDPLRPPPQPGPRRMRPPPGRRPRRG